MFEEKHAISILMFLAEHSGCNKGDIYSNVSTNPRMPIKLDELEDAGLIKQEVNKFRGNATTITLTVKGRSVVENLKIIEGILIG